FYISYSSPLFLIPLFFLTTTPPTQLYTLSLHDALPISFRGSAPPATCARHQAGTWPPKLEKTLAETRPRSSHRGQGGSNGESVPDRKSTRLNSSHVSISYAVFCLKKKKYYKNKKTIPHH